MTTRASIELDGQYRLLREEAGLVTRPSRGMLRVRGAEAAEFLQGQLTNDVEALAAGAGCYSALLDRKGHMQADMRVLRIDDGEFWIDTEPGARPAVLQHLNTYRIGRQVEVDDVSEEWAILSVVGPAANEAAGSGPLGPEHAHTELSLGGTTCRAIATELGLDLICPAPDVAALPAALGLPEASEDAAEILRVESGRPRFGREMSAKTIPEEAGINERAVSFTKGCYIGQETVARLHYRGGPTATFAACAWRRRPSQAIGSCSATERSERWARGWSPPRSARSRSRSCGARPSPARRSRWARQASPPRSSSCPSAEPSSTATGTMF